MAPGTVKATSNSAPPRFRFQRRRGFHITNRKEVCMMKKRSIIISALAVIAAAIGGVVAYKKRRGY